MSNKSICPFKIKTIYRQCICELSCEYLGRTKVCYQINEKKCEEMQKRKYKELGIE